MINQPPDRAAAEILYLSSAPSPSEFNRIRRRLKPDAQEVTYGMAAASFRFHNLILQGLAAGPAHIESLVGRPVSPRFHAGRFWKRSEETQDNGVHVVSPAFVNRPLVKQLGLAAAIMHETVRWRWRTRGTDSRTFFVDCSYVSALPGALLALSGTSVNRIGIFADLYSYMADVADASNRRLTMVHRICRRITWRCINSLDGFVVLTEALNGKINAAGKPHIVMEGIADSQRAMAPVLLENRDEQPTVLYAGALRKEYGLEALVKGFRAYNDSDARLVIYGQGDYAGEIRRHASEDSRIDFRGSVDVEQVIAAEERAWLLVNPRPADQEFTKFSFPSKNMEYLASGTAVLTTRLPGMPPEYYDYVLTIDGSSADHITEALSRSLGLGLLSLHKRGAEGRRFVLDKKNNLYQAGRMRQLALDVERHQSGG